MIELGFGNSDLSPAFGSVRPVKTPIECHALVVSSDTCRALWLVVDAMDLDASMVEAPRAAVAAMGSSAATSQHAS